MRIVESAVLNDAFYQALVRDCNENCCMDHRLGDLRHLAMGLRTALPHTHHPFKCDMPLFLSLIYRETVQQQLQTDNHSFLVFFYSSEVC